MLMEKCLRVFAHGRSATKIIQQFRCINDYFQFNFKFNLSEDMYAEDSVELLQNSGIQFDRHEREVKASGAGTQCSRLVD